MFDVEKFCGVIETELSMIEKVLSESKLNLLHRVNDAIDKVKTANYTHDETLLTMERLILITKRIDKL